MLFTSLSATLDPGGNNAINQSNENDGPKSQTIHKGRSQRSTTINKMGRSRSQTINKTIKSKCTPVYKAVKPSSKKVIRPGWQYPLKL